jgi:prepilin-type N-terminal cleavage/methylation domain-containing protein
MTNRGFTIVELLIVIVVIAILAAITAVSYNGIVSAAHSTSVVSSVKTYRSAIMQYAAVNGRYPVVNGAACLGKGYSDRNSDGILDCGDIQFITNQREDFNAEIATVLGQQPTINAFNVPVVFSNPSRNWVGATITYWDQFKVNGVVTPLYITYTIFGSNADCVLPGVVQEDAANGNFPNMKSGVFRNTWYDSRSTACIIPFDNL